MIQELLSKIEARTARIGVIGMGYVGLPLAVEFAGKGFGVTGFDIDGAKVEALNAGLSYIHHITPDQIGEARERGFAATGDFARLGEMDVIIVCVPTPLGRHHEPDLSYILHTADSIAATLRPGQLVVLESTTYPGTTSREVKPVLEATGLQCGRDFFLAFSPEREDPNNPTYRLATIPKIVGGVTERCQAAVVALYNQVVARTVPVSSPEVAEAAKLLENIYRCVNIAMVNELKVVFDRMGLDIWEVIDAAATKPFGFTPFYPGPGVGGHCIPVDPFYLVWVAREHRLNVKFIELAGEVNESMPQYVVSRVSTFLNQQGKALQGARVLVIGVAYKKDVDDLRESPAIEVIELLQRAGAEVAYHDPYVPKFPKLRAHTIELSSAPLTVEALSACDCALILTDHSTVDWQLIVEHAPLVVDTRNVTARCSGRDGRVFRA
jgi:UDP-N-acetyl-D-glucosamine dehydrogenase